MSADPDALTYDEEWMAAKIRQLDHRGQVAFVLSVAERLLPNYSAFVSQHQWGNEQPLREALTLAWTWLATGEMTSRALKLRKECLRQAPHTEDFDSAYVSPALDAANAASALLDVVANVDPERVIEAALLARDTVDMYVQDLEDMAPGIRNLEERIRLHPLMQREIKRQKADIGLLCREDWDSGRLEKAWRSPPRSNLDL